MMYMNKALRLMKVKKVMKKITKWLLKLKESRNTNKDTGIYASDIGGVPLEDNVTNINDVPTN